MIPLYIMTLCTLCFPFVLVVFLRRRAAWAKWLVLGGISLAGLVALSEIYFSVHNYLGFGHGYDPAGWVSGAISMGLLAMLGFVAAVFWRVHTKYAKRGA